MTWTHIAHPRCIKPVFGLAFTPHGSIWTCDTCYKRWMVDRSTSPSSWRDLSLAAQSEPLSLEPADVGARERRAALAWLDKHIDAVYADLGLERT